MKKINKSMSALLALVLTASLTAACGQTKEAPQQAAKPDAATSGATKPEAKPQEAPSQKFVLNFGHVLSESDPYHAGYLSWAKNVSERTKGALEIKVYPNSQLGVEEDIIKQIKDGKSLGYNTDSARMSSFIPEMAVMNAPYFVDSLDEVIKLNDTPTVKAWKEKLEKEHKIKILSFNWVQGFRHMVMNKPAKTPEDLKGSRIRTPGAPIWQESIRAVGATPVALPFGEIYSGIQKGTIDGADNVYNSTLNSKLFEVTKYVNETKHILLINFAIVSADFFNSLPADYQQILMEESDKAAIETSKKIEQITGESKKKLIENGMKIVEVDMNAYKAAGEKAYEVLKLNDIRQQLYTEMGKK
ncbi:C4-dicarboxylate TRAP transporter substrate-binding protein [Paenibacillus sp. YYML68]|uniref:C4-dicarboxylate TRAP transporter substrate-binding protein n=1 Tax=Paenibacillus sp. YYML68 TaxID=2909250 RepID=UPI00249371DF|nr:C4-dicarboxylate TRAP transporter substrate-binding protein [Paenibacillus sp. YYML68]